MRIFVEDIQDLSATIEVIAPNQAQIRDFFKRISVNEIITESVPALISRIML